MCTKQTVDGLDSAGHRRREEKVVLALFVSDFIGGHLVFLSRCLVKAPVSLRPPPSWAVPSQDGRRVAPPPLLCGAGSAHSRSHPHVSEAAVRSGAARRRRSPLYTVRGLNISLRTRYHRLSASASEEPAFLSVPFFLPPCFQSKVRRTTLLLNPQEATSISLS